MFTTSPTRSASAEERISGDQRRLASSNRTSETLTMTRNAISVRSCACCFRCSCHRCRRRFHRSVQRQRPLRLDQSARQRLGRRRRRDRPQEEFDGKEHNQEYLWTEQEYGDFVLELEFKIPERANSGVFLRTADMKDPVSRAWRSRSCNSYRPRHAHPRRHGRCRLRLPGPIGQPDQEAGRVEQVPHHLPFRTSFKWNSTSQQIVDMDLDRWTSRTRTPTARRTSSPRRSRISPGSVESVCRTTAGRSGTETFASNDWRRTCIR